jgi:hypothetical protein
VFETLSFVWVYGFCVGAEYDAGRENCDRWRGEGCGS